MSLFFSLSFSGENKKQIKNENKKTLDSPGAPPSSELPAPADDGSAATAFGLYEGNSATSPWGEEPPPPAEEEEAPTRPAPDPPPPPPPLPATDEGAAESSSGRISTGRRSMYALYGSTIASRSS